MKLLGGWKRFQSQILRRPIKPLPPKGPGRDRVRPGMGSPVDFSRFKTFAIRDARLNSKSPSLNSELVKKRINADIVKFLEAKGLEFVVEGPSQLNVRYTLGTVRKAWKLFEAYPAGWGEAMARASSAFLSPRAHSSSICATPARGLWCGGRLPVSRRTTRKALRRNSTTWSKSRSTSIRRSPNSARRKEEE